MPKPNPEYVEAVARATAKLEGIPADVHPPLSPAQVAQLAEAFRHDLPRFGDRATTAKVTDAGAQYFARVRILRVESAAPFPAQAAYAAWLPSGPLVLSGHPSAFDAVNAEERSALAHDPDLCVSLAGIAGLWSGASLMLEVRLNGIDDVPFRRANEPDRDAEADLRRRFGAQVVPPAVERFDDGVRLTMWLVSESRLRRRVSEIRSGAIAVTEEVLAEVPSFPGRMWGVKDKRFVPIG